MTNHEKHNICFFLMLFNFSYAQDCFFPKTNGITYEKSAHGDNCIQYKTPKIISDSVACFYNESIVKAALDSGLFIMDDDKLIVNHPGVPTVPIQGHTKKGIYYHGIAVCATTDKNGFHAAGGLCYFGVIEDKKTKRSFSLMSRPYSIEDEGMINFSVYEKILNSYLK